MRFSRILSRFPKTLDNLKISSANQSTALSTLPVPQLGSHKSFITIPPHQKYPILKTHFPKLANHHNRFIHGGLDNNQASINTTDEITRSSSNDQITQDIDKLCKILSTHSGNPSGVGSSLDHSGVSVSPQLVEEVLKNLSNAGALALSFFQWAEKQNGYKYTTESYNNLIEALGKIKQFKLIWNLVGTMKSKGLLTRETFGLIMRRYARARKIKEAIDTFEKMDKFGLKPELSDFNRLLDTLCKSRHVKEAQEVFDEMKKRRFLPDLKTYTILLEGWGQEQNIMLLKEVYREMKDDGFEPDAVTFGIIINAYCKARNLDEAVELFQEMEARRLKPTPHIYCTLIHGLGSDSRLNEALEVFERSKTSGFEPEIPTYNAVVGSYCWSKKFNDAYRVVEEMRKCGLSPNSRTYDIILHHLIKLRKIEEAYSVFQKMDNMDGCEPSLSTYTIIVTMFCNEGRIDMALKVWHQMKEKGIIPTMQMFSSLINGFCNENRLDDACNYFQEMLDMGIRPPGKLFANLKQALVDAGKKDVAINLDKKLDQIRRTPLVG